jgi:outer membrane protein OmpA-like peptidoglycan-associated protein
MATTITVPADALFGATTAALSEHADDLLGEPLRFVLSHPSAVVVVRCHTDSDAGETYNQTLSEQRASVVARWFEDRGVDPACITVLAWVDRRPIARSDDPVGTSKDGQVEIVVDSRPGIPIAGLSSVSSSAGVPRKGLGES